MSVTLLIDYMSQPSRAVLSFCLVSDIPFEVKEIDIIKGQTDTKEFLDISPSGTVPAIVHNGFMLYESHAILAYLANTFEVQDHWYPKDPKKRALVDLYLHWHHLNLRYGCGHYIYRKVVRPIFSKRPFSKDLESDMLHLQTKSLLFLEKTFSRQLFISSNDMPTIADISAYCEILQLFMIQFDFSPYPNIKRWLKDIGAIPGVAKAHAKFYQMVGIPKL
ncbi:hypothetical protein SteCoe_35739 [Stentor coeruleus]|uniref:Glutathione transferase n=1 Tax=Stentor coeruleus TaxID=5963 RepID=A0A1R2ARM5_9CILI|nr:hypothetical protein SteCoe_35739 [Stentor coeruleus]